MSLLRIRVSVLGFQYKVENSHNMFSCIISVSFRKALELQCLRSVSKGLQNAAWEDQKHFEQRPELSQLK